MGQGVRAAAQSGPNAARAWPCIRGPLAAPLQPVVAKVSSISLKITGWDFYVQTLNFKNVSEHFIPSVLGTCCEQCFELVSDNSLSPGILQNVLVQVDGGVA